ncbi:dienelactone hydrolase family protein [Prauserella cavernicola]|uniref:Alpha/beta fold hydrolase n=1 Tax=Prauserella cavernicola TaxID=2800127 RepID=A0A934QZ03_9PSEU|nr:alpha/beta fold hydrolase [Prauserella cavernicola]MBK1788119.1 alpha/beta fold hydrolase [Prauserella cavernicola]
MTVRFGVATADTTLAGELSVPADATGVVAFAHGSGSSRHSPRNVAVARTLQDRRLATLLFDLLSPDEDREGPTGPRFDIPLLAGRLTAAVDRLAADERTAGLPLGLFGASTGAAAALVAAERRPERVRAVVSRGGRPDPAGDALDALRCPVLLLVGERDEQVLRLNEEAAHRLSGTHAIETVTGATHLFEEPGALERVCELAGAWFGQHLTRS